MRLITFTRQKVGRLVGLGVRERLLGLAFIAMLLFGLWLLVRPEPFTTTVTEEHVLDYGTWTIIKSPSPYSVFFRKSSASTTLFLSTDGSNDSIRRLVDEAEAKLLAVASDNHDVVSIEFSNVILVCDYKSNCESTKKRVMNSAL
jgi:hypothetical protein